MKQRIISGVVLGVFCVAVIVFYSSFPPALNIAVALVSAGAVYELAKALSVEKKWFLSVPALAAAAAIPFCGSRLNFISGFPLLVYFLFTVVTFAAMIVHHKEITFKEVGVLYSMTLLIPTALSTLLSLRGIDAVHTYYLLLAVLSAWLADIGAYFAGTLFGKHKLCPEISPKKTVEGAVGGLVLDVAFMLASGPIAAGIFQNVYGISYSVHYLPLLLIGLLGSPISILGDLSFSLIKRSCHIKDFGQVIPGHGGMLDRFDSVIFTAPFVCLVTHWLPVLF